MSPKPITKNTLFYGDNLPVLREYIPDESVDLVYLDPPFNSNRSYNVLFREESGKSSEAQIEAFDDTWHWTEATEALYQQIMRANPGKVDDILAALRTVIGTNQMLAYLVMMAARLVELHRVLKPTGSLYLHCDPTASHYLKVILDTVFGAENFLNEIVWKRTTSHNDPQRFGRIGDRILYYSKSSNKLFNRTAGDYSEEQLKRYKYSDQKGKYRAENLTAPHYSETRTIIWRGTHPGMDRQWRFSIEELERLYDEGRILLQKNGTPRKDGLKEYLSEAKGQPLQDIWTDITFAPTSSERMGYPTQKPLALLERIVQASSNPGDVVLDPFCGCGTAVAAAEKLGRRWIGIDITHLSISLIKYRMLDMFPACHFEIVGEPQDLDSARKLAHDNRYQFQWWVLSLVRARPLGGEVGDKKGRKGSDQGIDGVINFMDDASGTPKHVQVQVKSGHVKSGDIRDLKGVMEREKAAIGVFLTLEEPTDEMKKEAAASGVYHSEVWQQDYPRLQILTVHDLLDGKTVKMPPDAGTFKRAEKVRKPEARQDGLGM
jgi:site-specific DNA-methyltransferase (adenine-specific)